MTRVLGGQRVLITGASQGIGAAIARAMAGAGADLVLSARDPDRLKAFATTISGVRVAHVAADLADANEVERLAGESLDAFGGIDVLVNNAGVSVLEPVVDVRADSWDLQMAVNLRAPALLASRIGASMAERGSGVIVNVASTAANTALANHYAYCTSKAALVMTTKMLALELGGRGVRANVVCPTVVMTEMGQRVWGDPERAAPMLSRIPSGRFARRTTSRRRCCTWPATRPV